VTRLKDNLLREIENQVAYYGAPNTVGTRMPAIEFERRKQYSDRVNGHVRVVLVEATRNIVIARPDIGPVV